MNLKAYTLSGAPIAWFDRFSPIPGLFTTSCISYTLLALQLTGFRGSENLLAWTRDNRTLVGIAVQVLSHILGIIYVQVLCAVLKTSFILSTNGKSFPIYLAHFIQAASTPRMTWTLPWRLSFLLLLIVGSSLLPAALWAGALTPLTSERTAIQTINIPTFEVADVRTLWDGDVSTAVSGANQWMTDKGLFSFDPTSMRGQLLQSAAEASTVSDNQRKHTKLDRTGYAYLNRSYGTGATAGFTSFDNITSPNSYSYQEKGFSSRISCFYNDSISEVYSLNEVTSGDWGGLIAQASGQGPFGGDQRWTTYYVIEMHDNFAWLPDYDKTTKKLSIQMITAANQSRDPWAFQPFNNIQCDLSYKADTFDVYINSTSQTVVTLPKGEDNQPWPPYGDAVFSELSAWLWSLTYTDGCVGGCQVGRSLRLNTNLLQNVTRDESNATVLRATEEYFGSITDNILINLILTRMVGNAPQPTEAVEARIGVPAIVFGDLTFVVIVVVLNTVILAIYIFEAIRTKCWAGLPAFDLSNICDVIIGATKGGMLVACPEENTGSTATISEQGRAWKTSPWRYSQAEPLSDATKIRLTFDDVAHDLPALVPLLEEKYSSLDSIEMTDGLLHTRKP